MNPQQTVWVRFDRQLDPIKIDMFDASTVPGRLLPSGAIHENAAHRFASRAEKVISVLPILARTREPQPCFVNESSGLQGLPRGFPRHLRCSETAQFAINKREQFFRRFWLAFFRALEHLSKIAHGFWAA